MRTESIRPWKYYENEDYLRQVKKQKYSMALMKFIRIFSDMEGIVLDIGCGTGKITAYINDKIPKAYVVGLDISSRLARHVHEKGVQVVVGTADSPCFKEKAFDRIVALSLIEHLHNPSKFLAEMERVLKPGGRIIIMTPNLLHLMNRIHFLFGKIPTRDEAFADPSHIKLFTYRLLRELLEKHNFKCTMLPFPSDNFFIKLLHKVSPTLFSREIICLGKKQDFCSNMTRKAKI